MKGFYALWIEHLVQQSYAVSTITSTLEPILQSLSQYNGVFEETSDYLAVLEWIVRNGSQHHETPLYAVSTITFQWRCHLRICSISSSVTKYSEGMERRYDKHPWCKLVTTNIHNFDNLKFHKLYYIRHLACQNPDCNYLRRASKWNKIEWNGYTTFPFHSRR